MTADESREDRILRRLDDPWKLGLWELDIAVPFCACLCAGMIRGTTPAFIGSAIVGWLVCKRIARLKAARHSGFFTHFMYWWLPGEFYPVKSMPPSAQREMVG